MPTGQQPYPYTTPVIGNARATYQFSYRNPLLMQDKDEHLSLMQDKEEVHLHIMHLIRIHLHITQGQSPYPYIVSNQTPYIAMHNKLINTPASSQTPYIANGQQPAGYQLSYRNPLHIVIDNLVHININNLIRLHIVSTTCNISGVI